MNQKPNSLIIGPGAIGSILCASIQNFSHTWAYRHRNGLTLPSHVHISTNIPLTWQFLDNDQQPVDLIWVCCKAEQSLAITSYLLQKFKQATAVLMHNGMGPQQQLAKQFPGRIIFSTTTNAVCKEKDLLFHQKAFGITCLGYPQLNENDETNWVNYIAAWPGNMGFLADSNITQSLWRKLAINAVINPLTAFYKIKNGDLAHAKYQSTIHSLCDEVALISLAEGIELPDLQGIVSEVISLTADNYSSMHQDVKLGRKTEVDYILGYILSCAKKHKIATPHIQHWYQTILSLHKPSLD